MDTLITAHIPEGSRALLLLEGESESIDLTSQLEALVQLGEADGGEQDGVVFATLSIDEGISFTRDGQLIGADEAGQRAVNAIIAAIKAAVTTE